MQSDFRQHLCTAPADGLINLHFDAPIHETTNISAGSDEKIRFCMKHGVEWSRALAFSPDQFRVLDSHLIAQSCS